MGSPPRTSEPPGRAIGREITARARPQLSLVRPLVHPRPGQLLRASHGFVMRLGLSQQNRALMTETAAVPVRPPIDYWPWPDTGSDAVTDGASSPAATRAAKPAVVAAPPEPPRKVDPLVEALRRKLLGGAKTPAAAAPTMTATAETDAASAGGAPSSIPAARRVVRRGLPLTPRRFGRTWAGPGTSPGGVANGAAPQASTTVAPVRFGGQSATDLPDVSRSGIRDSAGGGAAAGRQPVPAGSPRPSMDEADALRRKLARNTVPIATGPAPVRGASSDDDWAMPKPRQSARPAAETSSPSPLRRAVVRAVERVQEPGRGPLATLERPTLAGVATAMTLDSIVADGAGIQRESGVAFGSDAVVMPPRGAAAPDSLRRATSAPLPRTTRVNADGASRDSVLRRATAVTGVSDVAAASGSVVLRRGVARTNDGRAVRRVADAGPLLESATFMRSLRPHVAVPSTDLDAVTATPTADTTSSGRITPATIASAGRQRLASAGRSVVVQRRGAPADAGPPAAPASLADIDTLLSQIEAMGGWDSLLDELGVVAPSASSAAALARSNGAEAAPDRAALPDGLGIASSPAAAVARTDASRGVADSSDGAARRDGLGADAPAQANPPQEIAGALPDQTGLFDELGVVAPSPSSAAALARANADRDVADASAAALARALAARGRPEASPDQTGLFDELGVVAPSPSSAAALARANADRDAAAPARPDAADASSDRAAPADGLGVVAPAVAAARGLADVARDIAEALPDQAGMLDELGVVAPSPSSAAALARVNATRDVVDVSPNRAGLPDGVGEVAPSVASAAALARVDASSADRSLADGLRADPAFDRSALADLGPQSLQEELGVVAPSVSGVAAAAAARPIDAGAPDAHGQSSREPAADARARLLDDLVGSGQPSAIRRVAAGADSDVLDDAPTGPRQLTDELGIVAPAAFVRGGTEAATPQSWVPAGPGSLFSTALGTPPLHQRPRRHRAVTTPSPGPVSDPAVRPAAARVTAPDAAPEPDLGDRFLAELGRHRQERARPLPVQFRSIADVIVADRAPRISTSLASRRALAAVDKVAATTGDVIHLARVPSAGVPSAELAGIIAHELTHVANPSPAPRFFDDDRHSAEERRATEIGEIMRSTRLRPVAAPRPSRGARMSTTTDFDDATESLRRRVASSGSSGSSNGSADTIHRKFGGSIGSHRARPDAAPAPSANANANATGQPAQASDAVPAASGMSRAEFRRLLRENFDTVVEMLEDRLVADIERRGGRYRSDF